YTYANGSDTVVRINIGTGATSTARGRLTNTSKPSVFGNTCIIMATYRVVVYAGFSSTINLGGGAITIKDGTTGIPGTLSFNPRNAAVYSSPGLCPNAVSATNAIGGDNNGTFGTPAGSAPLSKNRAASSNVLSYIYSLFTTGSPQDYYYGITNNTSGSGASFSIVNTWGKNDNSSPTHRVFNVWDITGDHTGATNKAKGNPPCDTTKAVSATNPCGYMLVINSAYKTDTAFQYTVSNLCPNTYYEVSAWLRNMCSKCGCDSNGVGASGAGYIPFAPGDSSGIQPNIAFDINGTDYFTTGNLAYTGINATQQGSDSTNTWVKRGFTYLTGAGQSSLTLTLRNNAPGGGGNDWALDDITLATCLPNMQYSPSVNPTTCSSNPIQINDTISSYFNNYTNYKWQRSVNNGSSWSDVTGVTSLSPTYNYITSYTVPAANANASDSGNRYRVVVATTVANLINPDCQMSDGVTISLAVLNCGIALKTDLLSFNGNTRNAYSVITWSTSREDEPVHFELQRSDDNVSFTTIATINGKNSGLTTNYYSFTDPRMVNDKTWYRLILINDKGNKKYSHTIQLGTTAVDFELDNVINPFSDQLLFNITVNKTSKVNVELIDMQGKTAKSTSYLAYAGVNSLRLLNTDLLSSGIYTLRIQNNGSIISKKVMKKNN
ncbi:MAG: hypothetical protein JWQ09_3014, partial [Segetibacter sp.]|nr:hypothetical protein [Segetibacter sp.]